jgi:histidine triad (HIT) family protein
MSDCIFCKIAAGEIPSATIYEDEDFRVILDLGPATKGHALILPKQHFANITQMPEELTAKAFVLAKKIVTFMKGALPSDGYNIVQNNGEAAGQTVFHFHIHLIPRYTNDHAGVGWKPGELSDAWKEEILEKSKGLRD